MHPNLWDAPFTLSIQGAFTGDQMTFTAGDSQPQAQDSWWGPQKTVQPILQLVSEKKTESPKGLPAFTLTLIPLMGECSCF